MSEPSPCPACGTENSAQSVACRTCGYRLDVPAADSHKCARCGSALGADFEFCQICGLRVHSRRTRPVTQSLRLVPRRGGEPITAEMLPPVPPPVEPAAPAEPPAEPPAPAGTAVFQPAQEPTALAFSPVPVFVPADARPEPPGEGVWAPPPSRPAPTSTGPSAPAPLPRRAPGASALRLALVQRDGSEGEAIPLGDAPLTIGRWQADLRFPADEFLGPAHARVDPLPTGVRVVDLGTRNGVYVRITRPEAVFPGDLFLLGHHLLRLENIPPAGREDDPPGGVRGFGTPLLPAWGRLVLLGTGGVEAETHYLRHPQVVFGRELGDIVFPADPFVSWQHAQLVVEVRPEAMTVTLTDLRSANGTYLKAREDVILQPGDMFRVGDQIFRVRMH